MSLWRSTNGNGSRSHTRGRIGSRIECLDERIVPDTTMSLGMTWAAPVSMPIIASFEVSTDQSNTSRTNAAVAGASSDTIWKNTMGLGTHHLDPESRSRVRSSPLGAPTG